MAETALDSTGRITAPLPLGRRPVPHRCRAGTLRPLRVVIERTLGGCVYARGVYACDCGQQWRITTEIIPYQPERAGEYHWPNVFRAQWRRVTASQERSNRKTPAPPPQ